jgi:succinate-semialdehyde dehydrogenase/glutarate-semialdehyde dehydrogenase
VSAGADVLRRELVSVDPATLEPVGRVAVTPPEELAEVVAEARMAQEAFAREPLEARSALLEAVGHALVEDAEAITRTIVSESGKPIAEAYAHELVVGADTCRWLAANLGRVLREERLGFPQLVLRHKRGWMRYEPLGVVGIVTPWNFPLAIPLRGVAAAVAAGNAAVLKPSELTPLTGAWVEELFRRAGAPAGLVRVVQGPGETTGDALVRHRGVAGVLFTGSVEVGRVVAQAAAERLCPAVLELGGKDAMLVLDDADLDRAVQGALWGTFTNCGQACAGIERIAVPPGLHDTFVERLAGAAGALHVGHGESPEVELGPLVSEPQRSRFESLLADAVEHGATVAAGGRRPAVGLPGWFYEPTVLLGEPRAARLRSEELFGPGAVVVEIDNDDEMVRWANTSPFGLGASVWTRDAQRARAIAARLETGSVWVNDHAYTFGAAQAPWGGRRASGLGRTGSRHGLYAVSNIKLVDMDRGRLTPGWWFPYGDAAVDGLRGLLGALYAEGVGARVRAVATHRRGLAHLARKVLR